MRAGAAAPSTRVGPEGSAARAKISPLSSRSSRPRPRVAPRATRAGLSHLSLSRRVHDRCCSHGRACPRCCCCARGRRLAVSWLTGGGVVGFGLLLLHARLADWRCRRALYPPMKDEPGDVTLYAFDAADSPRRLCIEIVSLPAHGGLLRGTPRHARQSRPRDSALGDVPEPIAGERLTPAPHARRATDTTYIIHVYLPRGRHAHRTADTIHIHIYIYIIYIYTSII